MGTLDGKNIKPGEYSAKVSVNYDGQIASDELFFEYGSMKIEILEVDVKNVNLGEVAKVNILVQNLWTNTLRNVFVEIILFDTNGAEITRSKSASEDIPGSAKEELIAYWDTEGLDAGTYAGKLLIHYEDKNTEKQIKTIVNQNSIKVEFVGATGQVVAMSGGGNKDIMVLMLFILIGINIGWFIYFKRKK